MQGFVDSRHPVFLFHCRYLAKNHLTYIEEGAFAGLPQLEHL
jgi:hypothetical protein